MPLLHKEEFATPQATSVLASMPILVLNVHSNCNCRCVMCDIWKREKHDQLRAPIWSVIGDSLRNLGVRQAVLTGGEPLLHGDLSALCQFFREENIRLTLLTTGLLLHKRAEEIATLFDDVIVSLDGPREVHDAIRRICGAFDLITKGVAESSPNAPSFRLPAASRCRKPTIAIFAIR